MVIDVVPQGALWLFWFALGGCIGSFLNVCIYRLPREESLINPGSRCPHCRHPIAWHDNIPLLSWLALRGRCRHCHAPIHWRYPIVELLTASLTVAVLHRFGAGPPGWAYVAFVAALIAVSFIDLEFQIIPDEISLGGVGLGLVLSALLPALHGTDARLVAVGRSVLGLLVGGGVLYVTGLVGDLLFRKESMGGGDVKLMAMAGSLLGWKAVLVAFFLAPFLALLPGLYVLFWKRTHVIPYGPFLSLALVISLFVGTDLLRASGMEETVRLIWEYYGPR